MRQLFPVQFQILTSLKCCELTSCELTLNSFQKEFNEDRRHCWELISIDNVVKDRYDLTEVDKLSVTAAFR